MQSPDLHIISFAVPYPARYGGAIDVWNRVRAISRAGIRIHLHCFVYDQFTPDPLIDEVVEAVHYFPRVVWPSILSVGQPYIVTSRKCSQLLDRLKADQAPILFEGVHTTGFVSELTGRTLLLRAHNIEHHYYSELAEGTSGMKSLLFRRESLCLAEYETRWAGAFNQVFAISPHDKEWYAAHGAKTTFLPPFHGIQEADNLLGRGEYILYQGDLSIDINQHAVLDLMRRLPSMPGYPIVIAGRAGDKAFEDKLASFPNLRRCPDVLPQEMHDLIRKAQVILIHSLHGSGMKLKLFPALYHGRFVASTPSGLTHTGLDNAMVVYEKEQMAQVIEALWLKEFTAEMMHQRRADLALLPDDDEKAKEIIRYL